MWNLNNEVYFKAIDTHWESLLVKHKVNHERCCQALECRPKRVEQIQGLRLMNGRVLLPKQHYRIMWNSKHIVTFLISYPIWSILQLSCLLHVTIYFSAKVCITRLESVVMYWVSLNVAGHLPGILAASSTLIFWWSNPAQVLLSGSHETIWRNANAPFEY